MYGSYDTQLFSELYDVHPQAIIWMRPIFGKDGKAVSDFEFVYANDEGLRYLNLTREEFTGLRLSVSPTLNDELRKAVFEELLRVFTTGNKSETSFFNAALNKYARVLRTRLRDGVLSVVQDITRENLIIRTLEEQAEKLEEQTSLLKEQKALLDNILKNSSNGISVSRIFRDQNGTVVDAITILANDSAVNYIGLPRHVYLSKRATEIEPGIIGSPYYHECIKTLNTGVPFLMQYQMESTKRWLELTVSKLDHNHLIQIFTDITTIKEVQLQLERAATTMKSVFNAAPTGMFTISPVLNQNGELSDFRFVMVNSTVGDYLGQSPDVLEGELASRWFPEYMSNGVFEMYKSSYETGVAHQKEIYDTTDGHDNYLDLQSAKIDEHVLVCITDHTTLRKSQLKLEQTVKALERSNTHLEDFAQAASHDMKEPIRKILTFTDRLKSSLEPRITKAEHSLFDRIEHSAARMGLLVDDLLEFSHVSEQPRQYEAVNLNEKVERVLSDLELAIEEKNATIQAGPLPTVQGNRRQLQQLFQNLLSNALKYSKPGVPPSIHIHSRKVKGKDALPHLRPEMSNRYFFLIAISDNGIGFEQRYAEQIFKMFQRLHERSEYSGTGVGLSIARKVAENHNGFLWAEGELNKGATFKVLLPAD